MYSSLIRIHHQNEQTKKRDLKNIQDIMVFLGTLNENGNFTYSQAEEKCVLCSPISSLGCASARTSDERDALFDLRTQITIIFIVLIQVSFKEFTVFYIVKYLTKKLKKKRFKCLLRFHGVPRNGAILCSRHLYDRTKKPPCKSSILKILFVSHPIIVENWSGHLVS
jgi:hypothetical protein